MAPQDAVRTPEPAPAACQPPGAEDDRMRVRRMACADPTALGELYDRWSPLVYAVAIRLVGHEDDAEAVLESTFWHAWRHAGEHGGSEACVGSWLIRIACSRAVDSLHTRSGAGPFANTEVLAGGTTAAGSSEPITRTGRRG